MINCFLLDDEEHALKTLSFYLKEECPDVNVVATASNVEEALAILPKLNIDLAFFDVQLEDRLSFEVLESLEEINFNVIFVTAHHEYALKAFDHSAIDYVLKPINSEKLKSAVDKATSAIASKNKVERLELMFEHLDKKKFNKLVISTMDSFHIIDKSEIVYVESDVNYSYLNLNNGEKVVSTQNLSIINGLLSEKEFYRIHKSYLINVNFIKTILKADGGTVVMENEIKIPVARRRKEEFNKLMGIR